MRWKMSTLSRLIARRLFLKVGHRRLWDPAQGVGGSLDSTFSEPLFFTDHDPPSCVGSLGVLGKRHKGSHFVGLRRQPWKSSVS